MANPSSKKSEYQLVTETIKKILKLRKTTYRDLAKSLKLSESGLKKILNMEDGSFMRLHQICDVLDVSLLNVIQESQHLHLQDESFSEELETFFSNNLIYFNLFWKLVVERVPLEIATKQLHIDKLLTSKILRKLDQEGLIEWHANDKIKLPKFSPKRWVGKGPLTEKIQKLWSKELLDEVLTHKEADNFTFIVRYMPLTKESLLELKKTMIDVEEEFLRKSIRERSLNPDQLIEVKMLYAQGIGSFLHQ